MKFVLFILTAVIIFSMLLLGGKKYRSTALYALAIGGVVNANFFNATTYPIFCFGLPFGIDSLIYTLFIFCIIVMLISEGKKQAYILAISCIIAILFSALMQLLSDLLSLGSSPAVWNTFLSFVISAFASIIAIVIMVEILYRLKLNAYLLILIGIIIATLLNTGIYYPLTMLSLGAPSNIWLVLASSFIGKFIALICSLATYFALTKLDKKQIKGEKL